MITDFRRGSMNSEGLEDQNWASPPVIKSRGTFSLRAKHRLKVVISERVSVSALQAGVDPAKHIHLGTMSQVLLYQAFSLKISAEHIY
jgi:hypothetical protein